MKALILAAGYATRLYPLTKQYPKPLLLVRKKPIIDYIVDKLNRITGIDEIIVVTNSKFISLFRRWAAKRQNKKRISIVNDLTKDNQTRLGAIGDIEFAVNKKRIKDDLLVIGGDNLFDAGLGEFFKFAKEYEGFPVIGAYDIGVKNKARNYGVVRINKDNRVIEFQEKPARPSSTLVAMCLYYFPKEELNLLKEYYNKRQAKNCHCEGIPSSVIARPAKQAEAIPDRLGTGCAIPKRLLRSPTGNKGSLAMTCGRQLERKVDATGLYIDWLKDRCPVYGFVFGGRWYDIGDYKFYNEAREEFRGTRAVGDTFQTPSRGHFPSKLSSRGHFPSKLSEI